MIVECSDHLEEAAAIYLVSQQKRNQEKVMCRMRIVPHQSQLLLQVTHSLKPPNLKS